MHRMYDAVVIGSGFGGAIMACRLAQAGRSVAVLEKGRRWDKNEFPRTIGQMADSFWQKGKSHGFLEYRAFRKLDVIQGVGVGGGSLHYFNVHLRTPAAVFDNPVWPRVITRTLLEPYYDLAQDMMESRPLQPPVGRQALPPRTQVFLEAAQRASYPAEQVDIAVYTGKDRNHPGSGVPQNACTYCGNCLLGCHLHAKNTLDISYLGLAQRRHGAQVFPLHEVRSIRREDDSYRVDFIRLSETPGDPGTNGCVRATNVIVSAGTLGSSQLLLACRDQHGTLPDLSPALGSRFSTNGELLLAGALDTTRPVDAGVGPPITARVTVRDGQNLVTVQDLGLPDPLFWFMEGAFPPRGGRLRRVLHASGVYLLRSLGISGPSSRFSHEIDALLAGGRTSHFMPYLGMGTDAADGQLKLTSDGLDILWSHRKNHALYKTMFKTMRRISENAGGRFVNSFLWNWPFRKVLTAHPLGGCPMGDDPRHSVVDNKGQVWGYPGLYVVDGSVVPTALAVNPSLTISALAERTAFWLLHKKELGATPPPSNT